MGYGCGHVRGELGREIFVYKRAYNQDWHCRLHLSRSLLFGLAACYAGCAHYFQLWLARLACWVRSCPCDFARLVDASGNHNKAEFAGNRPKGS